MLVCSLVARMGAGAHALEKVAVLRLCVAFILHPQLLTPAPKHSYDCGQESHTSFWLSSSFFKLSISDPSKVAIISCPKLLKISHLSQIVDITATDNTQTLWNHKRNITALV